MSSHTQPQKVQLAFLTILSSCLVSSGAVAVDIGASQVWIRRVLLLGFGLLIARTGRRGECSPERTTAETSANAPRHEPPGLDLFPRRLGRFDGLRRGEFLRVGGLIVGVHGGSRR